MRVLTIANHKGGSGKTTTAINLSAAFVSFGHKTLIVDMDPQGNATSHLGCNPFSFEKTIYEALLDEAEKLDIEEVLVKLSPKLYLIPANLRMSQAEITMHSILEREHRLRRILERTGDEFEFVVVDTPPSLGILTVNSFFVADEIIIAVQTQPFALEAVEMILNNLAKVYKIRSDNRFVVRGLPTMHDRVTVMSREILEEINKQFGSLVLPPIHVNVKLREACMAGKHIFDYDPTSSGALDYLRVAKELINDFKEIRKDATRARKV